MATDTDLLSQRAEFSRLQEELAHFHIENQTLATRYSEQSNYNHELGAALNDLNRKCGDNQKRFLRIEHKESRVLSRTQEFADQIEKIKQKLASDPYYSKKVNSLKKLRKLRQEVNRLLAIIKKMLGEQSIPELIQEKSVSRIRLHFYTKANNTFQLYLDVIHALSSGDPQKASEIFNSVIPEPQEINSKTSDDQEPVNLDSPSRAVYKKTRSPSPKGDKHKNDVQIIEIIEEFEPISVQGETTPSRRPRRRRRRTQKRQRHRLTGQHKPSIPIIAENFSDSSENGPNRSFHSEDEALDEGIIGTYAKPATPSQQIRHTVPTRLCPSKNHKNIFLELLLHHVFQLRKICKKSLCFPLQSVTHKKPVLLS